MSGSCICLPPTNRSLVIKVNKYNAANEAYVRRSGVSGKKKENESDILVVGKDRNRAIHGDSVVVELLPEAQWKSKLVSGSMRERESESERARERESESERARARSTRRQTETE